MSAHSFCLMQCKGILPNLTISINMSLNLQLSMIDFSILTVKKSKFISSMLRIFQSQENIVGNCRSITNQCSPIRSCGCSGGSPRCSGGSLDRHENEIIWSQ